jgi:hypothetical protein
MLAIKTSPALAALLGKVFACPTEVTLHELFQTFAVADQNGILGQVQEVSELCGELGFELIPDCQRGDLDTPRILRCRERPSHTAESIQIEIGAGDAERTEFKTSLLFDFKRAEHDAKADRSQLKSQEVLHASLKTIAAFLTSGGGVLYVGVGDDGTIIGLQSDLSLLPDTKQSPDGWELALRDYIRTRFHEGGSINDYVEVNFTRLDGRTIARIVVASRRKLTFLKVKNACVLYRRHGNRTTEVAIEELEEFSQLRRTVGIA